MKTPIPIIRMFSTVSPIVSRLRSLSVLLLYLVSALMLTACEETPLKPGNAADLITEIKAAQKKQVRESSGPEAYECFTLADYRAFQEGKVAQKTAEAMKQNRKFMEGVLALGAQADSALAEFIASCRKPLRPTWGQLGRISPEGQTDAGNAAEFDIANAAADLIKELVKLNAEELQQVFRKP
jgi:hypothetical protein